MNYSQKNAKRALKSCVLFLTSIYSFGQMPLDPCFLSATPGTGFASSANLLNVASSDLMSWTGSAWTGAWGGANVTIPPPSGNSGCRAIFIGSGTAWTTGGEGFGIRLNAPFVSGQSYSYNITSVSHGTGSTGSFSPQVYSNNVGSMTGAVAMPNLTAVGTTWTTTTYTFTATAAQAGHTILIIRTSSVTPTASTGLISSFCLVNCSVALPVEFVDFEFECVDNKPLLNWSVASEVNNDYFTIWHSKDGTDFSAVGKVNGIGNSQERKSYSWPALNNFDGQTNYYKLSQTDFDGRTSDYKVISVNNCQSGITTAHISNGELVVRGENIKTMDIYDGMGKIVYSAPYVENGHGIVDGASSRMTSGVYHLIIRHEDNSIERLKLVKN